MKVNLLGKLFFGALAGAAVTKIAEAFTESPGRDPSTMDGNILAELAYSGDRRAFGTYIRSIRPGFSDEDVNVWYAKFQSRVKESGWKPS